MNSWRLIYVLGCLNFFVAYSFVQVSGGNAPNLSNCSFPAIYNFGDLNSDTGAAFAAFTVMQHPNGKSFFGSLAGRA
ncbi:GDSL esterase/lipase [Spatholobus suberectus]|nr:GDSL esterase/lipase [Spatholobus suberectus]